jgi:hypothetical protein
MVGMRSVTLLFALPVLLSAPVARAEDNSKPARAAALADPKAREPGFEALLKEAGDNYRTPEGHSYYDKFVEAAMEVVMKTQYAHGEDIVPSSRPVDFVFLIAADGTVKRLRYEPGNAFGEFMAAQLKAIKVLPPPPHHDWAVVIHIATSPPEGR